MGDPAKPLPALAAHPRRTWSDLAHGIAVLLFGVIIPLAILAQAYFGLDSLRSTLTEDLARSSPNLVVADLQPLLKSGNDYALAAVFAAEHTNQVVVTNKQVMKVAIMQVGFAVISLGLMLVLLGVNDGGGTGVLGLGDLKFDFKTGSTGVLVFVVGAAMATVGGVLKNDYKTVPIPHFVYELGRAPADERARGFLATCREQAGADYKECFANTFEHYVDGTRP